MGIRLMQEQERMMAAQREAMRKQLGEQTVIRNMAIELRRAFAKDAPRIHRDAFSNPLPLFDF